MSELVINFDEKPKREISPIKPGAWNAVCYAVYYLGVHKDVFEGEAKISKKICLLFEVADVIKEEGNYKGKRKVCNGIYTISNSEKSNLYKIIKSWLGEKPSGSFDFKKLEGMPCMVSVSLNANGYNKIDAITPVPHGLEMMKPENDPANIPPWIKRKMVEGGVMDPKELEN